MSPNNLQQRLSLLFQQDRFKESRELLENYLSDFPDDRFAQLNYVNVLLNLGEKKAAREVMGPIVNENPDDPTVLRLAASLELMDGKDKVAQTYAETLLQMNARDADAYVLMARIKMKQRNYDGALYYVDEALAINPEDSAALNLKIFVGSLLGHKDVGVTVEDALNLSPEDPTTIAQHAYSLLSQGKSKEALERARYALSLTPQNDMARYVMLEGLKARFPIYRGYFKYQQFMARLSGSASFGITIGLWIGVNALNRFAGSNPAYAPYVQPIVYFFVGIFLLSWIITPLMNFYLLTNQYGRVLLDQEEKVMARLVGGSFIGGVISFVASAVTGYDVFFLLGMVLIALTIPLGTFLRPLRKRQKQILTAYTVGLALVGLAGALLLNLTLLSIAGVAILAYQFILNGMAAREMGRTFGE
ncbi:tetratricopeptide repeat protein [Neolewinella antarctica]|uniref:Tetratricopeptide (TPR) repeat protein n=1 Tax=Neolewinella antarctica TaxID=442734 RepID=A0ABX0X6U5_9BACT|nr:tetratricopeptide repeat protein [Neolewinella antarctica]NJC24942.1 tetratricopeptide (TPR) repeat protein [Neolewinella antarctica]